jgi:hypothetical protein
MRAFPDDIAKLTEYLPQYQREIDGIIHRAMSIDTNSDFGVLLTTQQLNIIKNLASFFLKCSTHLCWTQTLLKRKIEKSLKENYYSKK